MRTFPSLLPSVSALAPTRRQLLGGALAACALGRPGRSRAAVSAVDRKFLFVQTLGGWDVTRVFAPIFGADVDMEPTAAPASASGIDFVDHAERPSVRAFFEGRGAGVAVLNGVHVPSIAHHSATRLTLTGNVDGLDADWATRLGAARADAHLVPHLVVGGANFAGPDGVQVGRAGFGGQLPLLATGDILDRSDLPVARPSAAGSSRVDAWLASAAERRASEAVHADAIARSTSYATALDRARQLKGLSAELSFAADTSYEGQIHTAATALAMGLSRCVTVNYPRADDNVAWDSHAMNDGTQNLLFEGLFAGLEDLLLLLEATPGTSAATLLEETVVVVLSEMGRTPKLNSAAGKDHWPYGSAMLLGPGVRGGQVIGAFDGGLYGRNVDLVTGDLDDAGLRIGTDVIGATILALGDVDAAAEGIDAAPLEAILE